MRMFQVVILGVVLVAVPTIANADCIMIKMDKTRSNEKHWDNTVIHTEPEPYVIVNGHDYEDQACWDSFICRIQIESAGSLMAVKVYDRDVGLDDYAGSCVLRKDSSCSTGAGATVYHNSSSCHSIRTGGSFRYNPSTHKIDSKPTDNVANAERPRSGNVSKLESGSVCKHKPGSLTGVYVLLVIILIVLVVILIMGAVQLYITTKPMWNNKNDSNHQ